MKCFRCGRKAVFWIHLGDFVVGSDPIRVVCENCLSVLSECVYKAERWKRDIRYWFISDAEINDKAKMLMEREYKRVGWI